MDGSVTGGNATGGDATGGGATGGNTTLIVVAAGGNITHGAELQKVGPLLFVCCKYRTCSIIHPPRINASPPLQGLSYCAGFLSRKHAPPCSNSYICVHLLDRACAIRDIHIYAFVIT